MSKLNTKYMYHNEWLSEYEELTSRNYVTTDTPFMTIIDSGTILPCKESDQKVWGIGGVVDCTGKYVDASTIGNAFGGLYPYLPNEVEYYDEIVIYIPIIPKHWGHFLIDCLCRFWFVLDKKYEKYRIAYCGYKWDDEGIDGNYLGLLNLLGVNKEEMIQIRKPSRFKSIYIPSATFGYNITNIEYTKIINKIVENTMKSPEVKDFCSYEKIYFTRTRFARSALREVGERELENWFKENNFKIISPENMTVLEQIFYVHTCKEMGCLNGTLPHNAVFKGNTLRLIILNKTPIPNPPQFRIDQLFNVESIYVDVYNRKFEKHPESCGGGPFLLETNDNLKRYFMDNNLDIISYSRIQSMSLQLKNSIRYEMLILRKRLKKINLIRKAIRFMKGKV